MRALGSCAVAAAFLMAAFPARGQVKAGPQFQISGPALGQPAVAATASGFVVAWKSGAGDLPIVARRFDPAGSPVGAELRVSPPTSDELFAPRVAAAPNGDFIVSWLRFGIDPDAVFARTFDGQGQPLAPPFRVDPNGPGYIGPASVAAGADGRFVIVWQSANADGSDWGILGRAYDRYAAPLVPQQVINGETSGRQMRPDVAALPDGSFVVTWGTVLPSGLAGAARRFDARFSPAGSDLALAEAWVPSVARGPGRSFVVSWPGNDIPVPARVMARWYGLWGPIGPPVRLDAGNTPVPIPDVATDVFGGAWAVWENEATEAVFVRGFPAPGFEPPPPALRVNDAGDVAGAPAIASDEDGNLAVVWNGVRAQSAGTFGQRFGGVRAAGVRFDTVPSASSDGNGVLEAGETVDVRTTWRNVTGSPLTLGGTLSTRLAPFPYGRQIVDASALYGTVPDGAEATCADCYAVRLDPFPGGRPPGHLDLPAVESLLPAERGLKHRWELHVGESFTDVPRGSVFYQAVETVLHRSVTGGCAADTFCPASSVTRGQMAAFLLRAKEWPHYSPRDCTMPLFADVPASSPFCRWIEELVRRGVTAGCGASSYCPGAPVTRAQMAVLVLRTLDAALDPPACTTPMFGDVPANDPFCRWIEELARRGAVGGCGGGNYCPSAATTREQMAAIVSVAFGLTF